MHFFKQNNALKHLVILSLICFAFYGCSPERLATKVTTGIIKGLPKNILDSVTNDLNKVIDHIVNGGDTLLGKVDQVTVDILSRTILTLVSDPTTKGLAKIQEALVGKTTTDVLRIIAALKGIIDDLPSQNSVNRIIQLKEGLIGAQTCQDVNCLLGTVLDNIDVKGNSIVSNLLGTFDTKLNSILKNLFITIGNEGNTTTDKIMTTVVKHLNDVNKIAEKDAKTILNYVIGIIVLAIVLVAVIGFAVYLNIWVSRYKKAATLMAKHIHHIKNQGVYDQVTQGIHSEGIDNGAQPTILRILKTNDLYQSDAWKKDKKVDKEKHGESHNH